MQDTYSSDTGCWPAGCLCPSQLWGTETIHPHFNIHLSNLNTNLTLLLKVKLWLNVWEIFGVSEQHISAFFVPTQLEMTEVNQPLYLDYQIQWCFSVLTFTILFLICLAHERRLRCWGSMCCSSWQTSPPSSVLSAKLAVQLSSLSISFFAFWICSPSAYLLLLRLGAVLSFPAPHRAP